MTDNLELPWKVIKRDEDGGVLYKRPVEQYRNDALIDEPLSFGSNSLRICLRIENSCWKAILADKICFKIASIKNT